MEEAERSTSLLVINKHNGTEQIHKRTLTLQKNLRVFRLLFIYIWRFQGLEQNKFKVECSVNTILF